MWLALHVSFSFADPLLSDQRWPNNPAHHPQVLSPSPGPAGGGGENPVPLRRVDAKMDPCGWHPERQKFFQRNAAQVAMVSILCRCVVPIIKTSMRMLRFDFFPTFNIFHLSPSDAIILSGFWHSDVFTWPTVHREVRWPASRSESTPIARWMGLSDWHIVYGKKFHPCWESNSEPLS